MASETTAKHKPGAAEQMDATKEVLEKLRKYGENRDIVVEVKDAFDMLDVDSDGKLSFNEVKRLLQMLCQNPSDREVRRIFEAADKDGNESLDALEYAELLANHLKSREEMEEELRKAFSVFDSDGNGRLDYKELRVALKKLGEPLDNDEIKELFDEMKANTTNNQVNIDAFVKTMCRAMYNV